MRRIFLPIRAAESFTVIRPNLRPVEIVDEYLGWLTKFDGLVNLAFDGAGRILMTNHAPVTRLVTKQFSIVDVEVADNGWPLNTPMIG